MAVATKQETKGLTLIEAIRQGIWEEMQRDETAFVISKNDGWSGAYDVFDNRVVPPAFKRKVLEK